MEKRIIYTGLDGRVFIVIPTPKARRAVSVEERESVWSDQRDIQTDLEAMLGTEHTAGERRVMEERVAAISVRIENLTRPLTAEEIAAKDVPDGVSFEIVDVSSIPSERTFRNAWVRDMTGVKADIPKARVIAHDMRRRARDLEMKPLDVRATIPSQATAAEAARQVVRDKYAAVQTDIDAAAIEADLLGIVQGFPVEE